ncbi:hypothetical protein DFP72DRAFT_515810 [Ephemerocybe angulata]|uniref:Uncharacterized protein n=1 Tax=Ephemerocybe angulata TaxID=980116 RepID=A0A8H6HN86_9AGAR|nr:hypothetical protein DFP72DRAFT_515810 [Tulosesus angulatus]
MTAGHFRVQRQRSHHRRLFWKSLAPSAATAGKSTGGILKDGLLKSAIEQVSGSLAQEGVQHRDPRHPGIRPRIPSSASSPSSASMHAFLYMQHWSVRPQYLKALSSTSRRLVPGRNPMREREEGEGTGTNQARIVYLRVCCVL